MCWTREVVRKILILKKILTVLIQFEVSLAKQGLRLHSHQRSPLPLDCSLILIEFPLLINYHVVDELMKWKGIKSFLKQLRRDELLAFFRLIKDLILQAGKIWNRRVCRKWSSRLKFRIINNLYSKRDNLLH